MAKTYNTVPANVTFTNNRVAEAATDPGANIVGVEYKHDAVKVQLFQLNSWIEVARGAENAVTILVQTSEEVAYYSKLGEQIEGLTVEVAAAE